MKPLTAKQLAKIYRKAAETVFKHGSLNDLDESFRKAFGCVAIIDAMGKYTEWRNSVIDATSFIRWDFPEFMVFENGMSNLWWGFDSEPRILALLFAEQFALQSK